MNECEPLQHGAALCQSIAVSPDGRHVVAVGGSPVMFVWDLMAARLVHGRGLHSSTSQLNISRFWLLKPQQASTSQLNLRRFCRCDL